MLGERSATESNTHTSMAWIPILQVRKLGRMEMNPPSIRGLVRDKDGAVTVVETVDLS